MKKFVKEHSEAKINCRFVVDLPNIFNIPNYHVMSCDLPSYSLINDSWNPNPIKIEFTDPINDSVSKKLQILVDKYMDTDGKISKESVIAIDVLNSKGELVEKWDISIDKIIEIGFGRFDYSSDEVLKPYMIIKPLVCHN